MKISYLLLTLCLVFMILGVGFYFVSMIQKPKVSVELDTVVTQIRDISPVSQIEGKNIVVPDIKNTITVSPSKIEEKPVENTVQNTNESTQNLFERGRYESQRDVYRI